MNLRAHDTKTTLLEELKIIPPVAWVVAGLWTVGSAVLIIPRILATVRPKPGEPPLELLAFFLVLATLILALWLVMIFYVNADAKRRQMNRLLWTLLVIFIPNAIGFIVYFLLRQPIARPCAKCAAVVRADFVFCPACGQALAPTCPGCHRSVETGWVSCAYCGVKLA